MHAQDSLYVYHHGGHTDSLCMNKVTQISHSRVDLDNVRHDDYVVMSVSFSDASVRQYLLATLDSVVMLRGTERYPLVCFSGSMVPQYRQKAPRRTSLDGDFMSKTGDVDFYWTEGDKIYVQNNNMGYDAADSVEISDSHRSADFFFLNAAISGNEIVVYYPGQTPRGYNVVHVTAAQSQQQPNNTGHIAIAGDCGTAVATKAEGEQSYHFELQHKASYLCFLPYIANDLGRTVLKKITVRSDSAIAGLFTLDPTKNAIVPKSDTTHVITLTTGGESGFVLPQNASQNSSAYMVIAPQNGSSRLTCEFTVYDTALQSEGVFTKTVDLPKIEPNMVYVVKANCNNYVVDLGLPVKFLNHNFGAFAPEENGGFFAYGELDDKGNYTSDNYLYKNTPYADLVNIRLTDKDVAHMQLGADFSMPTSAELNMLRDSCKTWEWQSSFNGKPGYKVTGKNGNVLFLPAAGYRNGKGNNDLNSRGCYRSSQLIASGDKKNWVLTFVSGSITVEGSNTTYTSLSFGESIRPVVTSGMRMTDGTSVLLMTDSVQWKPLQLSAKLFGTVYGISKAKTPVEIGFVVGDKSDVTMDDAIGTAKATATNVDGKYSANFLMPKDTCYYYRAYAKDQDGNINYGNALQFGHGYIDMGLPSGNKWANMNVGATRPDEDGGYYVWGETTTKSSYTLANHLWYDNKTCTFPEHNLRNIQATRHDAASMNWKGVWMMPDYDDVKELLTHCDWISATLNGTKGYWIKSRENDNCFFLPATGWIDGTTRNQYLTYSYILTSEVKGDYNSNFVEGDNSAKVWRNYNGAWANGEWRWYPTEVRPIWKTNATAADGTTPMYVRTLPALKSYDGTTETNTLHGVIRGAEMAGVGTTYGFKYWKDGTEEANAICLEATPDDAGHITAVITDLDAGTTYHYAAYIDNGTTKQPGQTLDITTIAMVDLGLSVKWANVNLGAESEGTGGDFYRWGATVPYRKITQEYEASKDIDPLSGFDMVTNTWGPSYRMPSRAECQELIDNTTRQWTTCNGYWGYRLTSTKEGYTDRSIFIPAAGYFLFYDSESSSNPGVYRHLNRQTDGCYLWSSTVYDGDEAYEFYLSNSSEGKLSLNEKNRGFPLRAVQEKLAFVKTLNIGRNTNGVAEIDTLIAFYDNPNPSNNLEVGFIYGTTANLNASNGTDCPVANPTNGYVKYVLSGLAKGTDYYYRAYVKNGDEYVYGNVMKFELLQLVDLGLASGTLWTNIDLGGNMAEDAGDYLAWGEIYPKNQYKEANYKYLQNGSYQQIGKLFSGTQYDIGGTEYDAATVRMGALYRIPSRVQCVELIDGCTWERITYNGVACWRGTSKVNGKTIIFPATELINGTVNEYLNAGLFQASEVYVDDYSIEHCLYMRSGYDTPVAATNNGECRYKGMTIRPVVNATYSNENVAVVTTTDACEWNIGATTATLHGTAALSTPVSGSLYGFIIGTIAEVSAETPNYTNVFMLSNSVNGRFSYNYTYDGSAKFFRSFVKIGSQYIMGEINSISAADLLDVEFKPDGSVFNATFTNLVGVQHGSPTVTYKSDYKRYEALFSGNSFASTPAHFYNFYFGLNNDFMRRLEDGHTLEVLMMLPETPTSSSCSDAFASYQDGGSGISVENKEICLYFHIGGNYRKLSSGVTPVGGMYYHVVAVWNKEEGKLYIYVDGDEKATMNQSGNFTEPSSNSRYYVVGGDADGSGATEAWPGTITFARIYDAPLTADQVSTLYSNLKK